MLTSWHYHVDAFSCVSIVSLLTTVFVQALAISTLSTVVTADILPEHLREFGISVSNTVLAASSFIVLKLLPLLSGMVGLHWALFWFAGFCLLNTLFIILYVPETKGKNYEEIMNLLQ